MLRLYFRRSPQLLINSIFSFLVNKEVDEEEQLLTELLVLQHAASLQQLSEVLQAGLWIPVQPVPPDSRQFEGGADSGWRTGDWRVKAGSGAWLLHGAGSSAAQLVFGQLVRQEGSAAEGLMLQPILHQTDLLQ